MAWRARVAPIKALATIAKGSLHLDVAGWLHQGRVEMNPTSMLQQLKEAWEAEWCDGHAVAPSVFLTRFPFAQQPLCQLSPLCGVGIQEAIRRMPSGNGFLPKLRLE